MLKDCSPEVRKATAIESPLVFLRLDPQNGGLPFGFPVSTLEKRHTHFLFGQIRDGPSPRCWSPEVTEASPSLSLYATHFFWRTGPFGQRTLAPAFGEKICPRLMILRESRRWFLADPQESSETASRVRVRFLVGPQKEVPNMAPW